MLFRNVRLYIMLKSETMEELVTIVGLDTALKVVAMEAIQLSMKIKKKTDFLPGGFANRIIKRFNTAYWSMDIACCVDILNLVEACQLYERNIDLAGLGGCEALSLACTLERETVLG